MGVVYEAHDTVVKRGIALKTLRDIPSRAALDLFYKECDVLASMSHPNIVEIFDIGEFEEDGANKPYFVMPLLPGKTLEELIRTGSTRLTVNRCVEIIAQTCRGLQAAHERHLVHRDLKPSNIFVMEDDSVKIIDFGVAHMADNHSTMSHKGTLLYMAPEQVEMKPTSALSDIFSLGVVCFETLTLRHPFERGSSAEVVSAILKRIPPPASELNPSVNGMISRVVHKAMAKQPWHRFSSAREFGEALQKAARNEPLEMFDPARIQPRIQRAAKAFEQLDYQFAEEILTELEAEGHVDPGITSLRRQLDQAQRQKLIAQLLQSARTRAEEQEYPLALQKLQELLELDPTNGTALALKRSIEERRSSQKVEDWLRLARQHLEQHGFSHARQALQNVLDLNPTDTRALQLAAEVDRREQEFVRLRREKEDLYAKAQDAWQSGEVSAALSKLERLVEIDRGSPDTGAPERSATFQSFYNQVRSEHDAIKNDYERARRLLVDGNFDAALQICTGQLARHPEQALFQALQFDIEERRRQQLSARIAEVDRRVESEPDLEKRVSILAEAVERFPGEPHFERALRTTRDKRELVNSIVSRARALEEREQFAEALAQWEILRTIYSQYPGFDFETERVCRRRDQQVRTAAKVRWVEQIDWQFDAGEFLRAIELLDGAAAEFPDDPELEELRKQVLHGQARGADAQKLLAEGQQLCSAQRLDEGVSMIEQAHQLYPKNALIRAALIGALIEQARGKVETDWQGAEELADRALLLDPANSQAKSLKSLALDRKREQFVDNCVAVARRLQTEGQIDAALEQVERGLGSFPRETRLSQLRATLSKAQAAATADAGSVAHPPPVDLRPLQSAPTETVALPSPISPPAPAVRPHLNDETIAMPPPDAPAPTAPAPAAVAPKVTSIPSVPEPAAVAPKANAVPSPPAPPATSSRPAPASAPKRQPTAGKKVPPRLIAAGIAAVVLFGAAILVVPRLKRGRASAPAANGAAVSAAPVTAAVEAPIYSTLRVFADLEGGKFSFDNQPSEDLQEGQISLDNIAPGAHTLKIVGPREQATITFEMGKGALPKVNGLTAKEALAVAVTSMSPQARVQSSGGSAKIALDGNPAGETGESGLQLNGLPLGNHELGIGEGKERRSMVVGIGPAPMLTVFLKSDRNVGTLLILTGEDGVRVYLNGKEYRRQTQRGQLRIPNLDINDYSIRVSKPGFLEVAEQHIAIRKGEESKLEFQLKPVPKVASLAIQGALPSVEVFLDQDRIGTVQDDGSFTASSVQPGDHVVELRKESYKPKRIEKRFDEGASVQLGGADVALERLLATLKWTVTPADAQMTISRQGDAPKPVSGSSVSLPDGTYTLTARAPNHSDASQTISLAAGEAKTVELKLAATVSSPKSQGMSDWDNPGAWTPEAGWYVRKGGDFIGYKPTQTNGVFLFTLDLRKGKRLQWSAARTDAKNYVLFQMDKKVFYRSTVVNGKETQLSKTPHQAEKQKVYTIEMTVANGSIVHRWYDGSNWVLLDRWDEPGRAFGNGKFGFLIPGGDTIALSNFSFTPK